MTGPFGTTFAPTEQAAEEARRRNMTRPGPFGAGGPTAGSESAVQVLQLSLPRVLGSRAPAAAALVNPSGPHSSANPDSALVASLVRALFGPTVDAPDIPTLPSGRGDSFSDGLRRERDMNRPSSPVRETPRDQGPSEVPTLNQGPNFVFQPPDRAGERPGQPVSGYIPLPPPPPEWVPPPFPVAPQPPQDDSIGRFERRFPDRTATEHRNAF